MVAVQLAVHIDPRLHYVTHALAPIAAQVMDFELQRQLVPHMKDIVPLPGIYDPDFIAANQDTRANNVVKGSKKEQMETIRQHIREFKQRTQVDKVIVLWTANTERYAQVNLAGGALLPPYPDVTTCHDPA